jgi:hypothetical protein
LPLPLLVVLLLPHCESKCAVKSSVPLRPLAPSACAIGATGVTSESEYHVASAEPARKSRIHQSCVPRCSALAPSFSEWLRRLAYRDARLRIRFCRPPHRLRCIMFLVVICVETHCRSLSTPTFPWGGAPSLSCMSQTVDCWIQTSAAGPLDHCADASPTLSQSYSLPSRRGAASAALA